MKNILIICYHVAIFCFLAARYYLDEIKFGGNVFTSADWLVSYRNGFVRRGAAGQLFWYLFPTAKGEEVLHFLFVFQHIFVGFFLYFMIRILLRQKSHWLLISSVIVSPVYLNFWVLNPQAYLRKELLGFLSASYFVHSTLQNRGKSARFVFGLLLFYFAILSHEAAIIFLPLILYTVYLDLKNATIGQRSFNFRILILFASTILLTLLSIQFRWLSSNFCYYLVEKGLGNRFCGEGGIAWAMRPEWWDSLWNQLPTTFAFYFPQLFLYFLLFLIPIVITAKRNGAKFLAVTTFCSLPIFVSSYDWGRWILVISVSIILFSALSTFERLSKVQLACLTLLLPSSLFYSIPYCCSTEFKRGLVDYLLSILAS